MLCKTKADSKVNVDNRITGRETIGICTNLLPGWFSLNYSLLLLIMSFTVLAFTVSSLSVSADSNISNTVNHIIISEVLYNPNGTETGREAVELYNPTDSNLDIGNWYLRTESSNKDAVIPQSALIRAKSYFLIADSGWSQNKDSNWVMADYEEAITLSNTDAGVALINSDNETIDSVGWGSDSGINAGLSEGSPAQEVNDGYSLSRREQNNTFIDTNNNSFDFYETLPNLKNSNSTSYLSNEINLNFEVVEIPLLIRNFTMTDDMNDTGFQILPNPDGNKTIKVRVNVSPENAVVYCTASSIGMRDMYFNQSSSLFVCDFQIPYYQEPGLYNLSITAHYNNKTSEYNESFYLMGLLALKLDSSKINVGQITQGKGKIITGDNDITTLDKPTVKNIGNVNSNIQVSSSGVYSSTSLFSLSNIEFSFTPDFSSFAGLLNETKDINVQLLPTDAVPLYFKINVPSNQSAGVYSGAVVINAVS